MLVSNFSIRQSATFRGNRFTVRAIWVVATWVLWTSWAHFVTLVCFLLSWYLITDCAPMMFETTGDQYHPWCMHCSLVSPQKHGTLENLSVVQANKKGRKLKYVASYSYNTTDLLMNMFLKCSRLWHGTLHPKYLWLSMARSHSLYEYQKLNAIWLLYSITTPGQ